MLVYFALSLAIIMAVCFIVFQTLGDSILSCILKLFASITFVLLGVAGFATSETMTIGISSVGLLMLVGSVFGLVGDGILALKDIDETRDFLNILCGTISFAIGHIFYYVALIQYAGFSFIPLATGALLVAIIMIVSMLGMKLNFGKLLIPTIIYAFILSTTMIQAFYGAIVMGGSLASILLLVGFVLFLLSDLVLSIIYFVPKKDKKLVILNLTLYYLAQILIMFAIFFL